MTMKHINETLNSSKSKRPQPDSFEGLPIRPSVKKTRLFVDNEYFERGYAAVVPHSVLSVYGILARYANHKSQTCYPSAQTIMRLGGIKNRRTVFDAIKILEAFDIIAVVHSRGRVSNHYALLDPSAWKTPNSDTVDTVRKTRRSKPTVSVNTTQQSQKPPSNGGADDTRSHLTESDKEIKDGLNKTSIKGKELLQRLSPVPKALLTKCFHEDDIIAALEELVTNGSGIGKLGHKSVLEALSRRGAIPKEELPSFLDKITSPQL